MPIKKDKKMATIEKRLCRGKYVYRARVRRKGAPMISATFPTKTLAQDWAQKAETQIKENTYFPAMQAQRHTLNEAIDLYVQKLRHASNSQQTTISQLNVWRTLIGDFNLAQITPAKIVGTLNKIENTQTPTGKTRSAGTLNRYLSVLSSALTFAKKELGWIQNNPAFNVSKMPEPQGRVRFLSDDERERLLGTAKQASNPFLYPAVILAISTGARRGEILSLRWEDVDLDKGWARIQKTKNGERRGIPIKSDALIAMRDLYNNRPSDIFVFPNESNSGPFDIRRSWEKAIKQAHIEDFRFHDLRHTCASYLRMDGASDGEIADVLGHKTLQMVKRYAHVSDKHKSDVVEKMNKKIFGKN